MGWFLRPKKGIAWRDQALASFSLPPLPLIIFSGLLLTMVYLATHSDYKERVERRKTGFRFTLLFLPLMVVVAVNLMMLRHRMLRYNFGDPRPLYQAAVTEEVDSAPGLLFVVVLLLVLVYYQSTFQSSWFRFF